MKFVSTFIFLVLFAFSAPMPVQDVYLFAQEGDESPTNAEGDEIVNPANGGTNGSNQNRNTQSVSITNPLAFDSLTDFFLAIIEILLIFAIPIIVFFIIYSGFLYVTAQGDSEQVKKASRSLLYAVIGGLLILGANLILAVIQSTVDSFTI